MTDDRIVDATDLHAGPVRHATLPGWFIVRAQLVIHVLGVPMRSTLSEFVRNFQRDADPVRELEIWERIACAFLALAADAATEQERSERAAALLQVSMLWPMICERPPSDPLMLAAVSAYKNAGVMRAGDS